MVGRLPYLSEQATKRIFSACKKRELCAIILFVLFAIFIRAYHFGSVPIGLNQDEASTGVDAYMLARYGTDRHGTPNPAALIAWGSGMYALAAYSNRSL